MLNAIYERSPALIGVEIHPSSTLSTDLIAMPRTCRACFTSSKSGEVFLRCMMLLAALLL